MITDRHSNYNLNTFFRACNHALHNAGQVCKSAEDERDGDGTDAGLNEIVTSSVMDDCPAPPPSTPTGQQQQQQQQHVHHRRKDNGLVQLLDQQEDVAIVQMMPPGERRAGGPENGRLPLLSALHSSGRLPNVKYLKRASLVASSGEHFVINRSSSS